MTASPTSIDAFPGDQVEKGTEVGGSHEPLKGLLVHVEVRRRTDRDEKELLLTQERAHAGAREHVLVGDRDERVVPVCLGLPGLISPPCPGEIARQIEVDRVAPPAETGRHQVQRVDLTAAKLEGFLA